MSFLPLASSLAKHREPTMASKVYTVHLHDHERFTLTDEDSL